MPPIKLSKVTIPPRPPKPTPVSEPLPGAPVPPPFDPGLPDPALPDTGVDVPPVEVEIPADQVDPPVGTFAAAAKRGTPEADSEGTASIPTELIDKLWRAIDIVPGLTLDTALTLALQQFLATLPEDYEREDG